MHTCHVDNLVSNGRKSTSAFQPCSHGPASEGVAEKPEVIFRALLSSNIGESRYVFVLAKMLMALDAALSHLSEGLRSST